MSNEYLKIIKERGEFDFEVSALIQELTKEEYEELKSMLVTAVGTMEEMRRRKAEAIEFDVLRALNEDLDNDVEMSNM